MIDSKATNVLKDREKNVKQTPILESRLICPRLVTFITEHTYENLTFGKKM